MFYKKIQIIKDDKILDVAVPMAEIARVSKKIDPKGEGVSESYLSLLISGNRIASEEVYRLIQQSKAYILKSREIDA